MLIVPGKAGARLVSVFAVLLFFGLATASTALAQKPPIVAAASDLKFALEDVTKQFTAGTGERVELVFGSSGNLTRQLLDGAPYELFLSADEAFADKLSGAGLTRDR